MSAADGVEKMELAHEIVVNGDFKLEPTNHNVDRYAIDQWCSVLLAWYRTIQWP